MANSKKDKNKKENTSLKMFDKAVNSIFSLLDNGHNDREILNAKDQKFRSILNRELEISKGVSQGSIIDFVSSVQVKNQMNMNGRGNNNSPDTNELFTQNINDIFGYFQDLYRNRYIEMDDLKFIAKFIPSLGEAIRTYMDSIASSDNMAETINRKLDLPTSVSEENKLAIRNEIERNEKDLKLLKKLKNTVYKKTLITGTHYVYAVSYRKIFEEYDKIKKEKEAAHPTLNNQFGNSKKAVKTNESYILGDIDISSVMESVNSSFMESSTKENPIKQTDVTKCLHECYEQMPKITCESAIIDLDALEDVSSMFDDRVVMEAFVNKPKMNDNKLPENSPLKEKDNQFTVDIPDGTKGYNTVRASKFDMTGTYIKYIDAKNIIPLKVFDQKIGYYLVHPKVKKNGNSTGMVSGINSIGTTLFSAVNVGENKKHDAVERIVNAIAEGIMQKFDHKFVMKNAEYKKLIADVIIANGLTNQDYNIQFIPADDIIEFKVNENDEGFGTSVIQDSLFPAKLLLSTRVCRILNYINKTGNKSIAHVYKGPVNAMTSNHINRVIRDLQEQNVTFNDLLSPNLVFNKFNRDGNLTIPTAKNGQHLIELETQEGQNIDMSPEYERDLEKQVILGTGVPVVVMDYEGSADFAKQVVSAYITFAGRISSIQSDLEEPTTKLYKKICMNSNLTDEQKDICAENLEFKLIRPRVLTNTNNSDFIQTTITVAETIADTIIGRESVSNPDVMKNGTQMKEKLMLSIVKELAPFVDWDEYEDQLKMIKMELQNEPKSEEESDAGGGF